MDPRKVTKYIDLCQKQLDYHKVVEKYRSLIEKIQTDGWTIYDIDEYAKIDRLNSESMVSSERNSSNIYLFIYFTNLTHFYVPKIR
jgi:hypothetical protein